MFTSKKTNSHSPLDEQPVVEEAWAVSSQRAVSDDGCPKCNGTAGSRAEDVGLGDDNWLYMSAVCYIYGKTIQAHTGLPIGLVNTNWGGTPVEFWMSNEAEAACATAGSKPPAAGGAYNGTEANWPTRISFAPSLSLSLSPSPRCLPPGLCADSDVLSCATSLGMIKPILNMTITGAIWYQGTVALPPFFFAHTHTHTHHITQHTAHLLVPGCTPLALLGLAVPPPPILNGSNGAPRPSRRIEPGRQVRRLGPVGPADDDVWLPLPRDDRRLAHEGASAPARPARPARRAHTPCSLQPAPARACLLACCSGCRYSV